MNRQPSKKGMLDSGCLQKEFSVSTKFGGTPNLTGETPVLPFTILDTLSLKPHFHIPLEFPAAAAMVL